MNSYRRRAEVESRRVHIRLRCLLCGERKATLTSPDEQTLLTFECRGCHFAWSSLNPLGPTRNDESASTRD
jgi:hypothetical protein